MRNKVIAIILIVVLLITCVGCTEYANESKEIDRLIDLPLADLTDSEIESVINFCKDSNHAYYFKWVAIYQNEKLLRKG